MVQEMNYNVISSVLESWEALRRIKNYEQVAGIVLFKKLFTMAPETKVLFGFPIDLDPESEELVKSKRFLAHSSYLIQMIDSALNMLGPDIELLTEILTELGDKHVRYGVQTVMFKHMGLALIETLEETLGKAAINEKVKLAWVDIYDALSGDMIKSMKISERRRSTSSNA